MEEEAFQSPKIVLNSESEFVPDQVMNTEKTDGNKYSEDYTALQAEPVENCIPSCTPKKTQENAQKCLICDFSCSGTLASS